MLERLLDGKLEGVLEGTFEEVFGLQLCIRRAFGILLRKDLLAQLLL